ncbi:chemotaxis protein CheW [Caballeronia ptereochthonis]|uniref:Chemotaxis protein CheW n=1 Tax=Caballeronia ptereochthonis TaxID=1777144 RepID=A0A157ZVG9_9BURK|nr:chemotaxis protein CheW [Caballeronia ptereochthonis]SAK49483.1 chemotaxis protein CheW [Caballeronia ptereochthonis]
MNARTPAPFDAIRATDIDDCWNRIGVRGDASCPKLEHYVHCRNCPVHDQAASRVLDRVEARTSIERTGVASSNIARSDDEADTLSCLVFRIGGEWLGLPTTFCAQVAQLRPVHSLPHRRHRAVLGVVNVRGRLIVCASLARLFGIEGSDGGVKAVSGNQAVDARELGRLLVVQRAESRDHHGNGDREGPIAFPVDAVDGVHRFSRPRLQPVPATLAQRLASHAHAVSDFKGATVGLLDAERLIDSLNRSLT